MRQEAAGASDNGGFRWMDVVSGLWGGEAGEAGQRKVGRT